MPLAPGEERRVNARILRLITQADRAEAAAVRAARGQLVRLQGELRSLVAARWGDPLPLLDTALRDLVRTEVGAIATALVDEMARSRRAGANLVDEIADVLGVAMPAGEAEEAELQDGHAIGAVTAAGPLIVDAVSFELLRAQGQQDPDSLRSTLVAIGSTLAGSVVMGRAAERIAGQVRANLGLAYGSGTRARAGAAERVGVRLRKRWIAQHSKGNRRQHLATEARYAPGGSPGPIPFGEDFAVGTYRTPYPRGPGLPPGHKVHCRCRAVPVVVDVPRPAAV